MNPQEQELDELRAQHTALREERERLEAMKVRVLVFLVCFGVFRVPLVYF